MIKIKIDTDKKFVLNNKEIRYVFETICITIGVPWDFINEEDNTQPDIYYGINENIEAAVKIVAKTNEIFNPHLFKYKKLFFIENDEISNNPYDLNNGKCVFKNDIVYSCFYLLSGKDELNIERNKFDHHNIKQSILYKNKVLHKPLINEYAEFIKNLFKEQFEFIPKWPNGKKAALALSHDVDYPEMIKSIELLRYVLKYKLNLKFKTVFNIIFGKEGIETFWLFENYMRLEQKYNAKSAFYFCSFKGNLPRYLLKVPDSFYNIKKTKYKSIVNTLKNNGFEVGLHSSYLAYTSYDRFKGELNKLKEVFQLSEVGNRHHYWHNNPEDPSETCAIHQKLGLAYDSSISFEQHSGFRYSICTPFHIWNKQKGDSLKILQLPPTLMDNHLFGYEHLSSFETYEAHIDNLINAILKNNGIFVADFHVRVLNNTFFPKWGEAYEYLLQQIQNTNQFYVDTPMNIQKHWTERERLIRSKSKNENSSINK